MAEKIPTWGYAEDGTPCLFELPEGEGLPAGWSDRPPETASVEPDAPPAPEPPADPAPLRGQHRRGR